MSWRKGLTVGTRPCVIWGPVKEPLEGCCLCLVGPAIGKQSWMRIGEEEGQMGAHFRLSLPPNPMTSWRSWNPSYRAAGPWLRTQKRPGRSCGPSASPMATWRASSSAPGCAVCAATPGSPHRPAHALAAASLCAASRGSQMAPVASLTQNRPRKGIGGDVIPALLSRYDRKPPPFTLCRFGLHAHLS